MVISVQVVQNSHKMSKYSFIFTLLIALASGFESEDDDYFDDEISQYENLKMTDVLKMIVLPSAKEISNILTSEDNSTNEPINSPRLDFILQAIDYWRKHNIPDELEEVKGENITKVTFNLRDDFFDEDSSAYSHLSKKLHNTQTKPQGAHGIGSRAVHSAMVHAPEVKHRIKTGDVGNKVPAAMPYIYVKNLYLSDPTLLKDSHLESETKK